MLLLIQGSLWFLSGETKPHLVQQERIGRRVSHWNLHTRSLMTQAGEDTKSSSLAASWLSPFNCAAHSLAFIACCCIFSIPRTSHLLQSSSRRLKDALICSAWVAQSDQMSHPLQHCASGPAPYSCHAAREMLELLLLRSFIVDLTSANNSRRTQN